jgi:hypothetical protein
MWEPTQNRRGKQTDNLLLQTTIMYPGLSQYEIAKQLGWPSGRVDGAVRRLVNQKLITINRAERNGRTLNLIYPKDTLYPRNTKPQDTIEVPANLLRLENGEWKNTAFAYALDSTTIAIASHEKPEWKENVAFTAEIPIRSEKRKVVLTMPEKFTRFYNIGKKQTAITINDNSILITISGNIVEAKKYPASRTSSPP